ncbi:MAG TPA: hypothetical protein VGR16_10450 [Thermomicrobiales bacterium]|nr:hypothetical protein [Thermomicrobiales bacterium]
MTSNLAATPIVDDISIDAFVAKQLDLLRRFTLAAAADEDLLDSIPNGVTLVLLPDDDPAFVEREVSTGLDAIRRGEDVYFLHVEVSSLPE